MRSGAGPDEAFTSHPRRRGPSSAAISTASSPGRGGGPEPTSGCGKKMRFSWKNAIITGTARMPTRASATPTLTSRARSLACRPAREPDDAQRRDRPHWQDVGSLWLIPRPARDALPAEGFEVGQTGGGGGVDHLRAHEIAIDH